MTVGECPVGDDSLGLLLGDGLPLTLAGTGVGAGALTTNRKSAAVTTALVSANLDLAADVSSHLTAKVTFDVVVSSWTRRSPLIPVAFRVSVARVRPIP